MEMGRDLELVQYVRTNRAIFDKYEPGFKDNDLKNRIWERIGERMGDTAESCLLRWRALRERYVREKKNRLNFKKGGQLASRLEKWPIYKAMAFLDGVITHRKRKRHISTLVTTELNDNGDDSEIFFVDPSEPTIIPKVEEFVPNPNPPPLIRVIACATEPKIVSSTSLAQNTYVPFIENMSNSNNRIAVSSSSQVCDQLNSFTDNSNTNRRSTINNISSHCDDPLGTETVNNPEDADDAMHFTKTVQIMILKLLRDHPEQKFDIMVDTLRVLKEVSNKYES